MKSQAGYVPSSMKPEQNNEFILYICLFFINKEKDNQLWSIELIKFPNQHSQFKDPYPYLARIGVQKSKQAGLIKFLVLLLVPGLVKRTIDKSGGAKNKSHFLREINNNQRSKFQKITFLFSYLFIKPCFGAQEDLKNELLIECRYELVGHTLFLDHWLLRYGLASPEDLFRALQASPEAILPSPGRRTREMLRPGLIGVWNLTRGIWKSKVSDMVYGFISNFSSN